jgi:predicted RNA-binding protein associated with RNAse of E/G family
MTNVTVLVDTLTKAVNGGLISQEAAHAAYNYDNDEEQNAEDYAKVVKSQEQQKNTLFGGDMI